MIRPLRCPRVGSLAHIGKRLQIRPLLAACGASTIALAQKLTEVEVRLRTILSPEQYDACAILLRALQAAVAVLSGSSLLTDDSLRERYRLTGRESAVLRLLLLGQSNTGIAHTLHVSEHTARHHTERILRKVHVHSRAQLAAAIGGCVA